MCSPTQSNKATSMMFSNIISFGKYKGKNIGEAIHDKEFFSWITHLASSPNHTSAQMGQWYLEQIRVATAQPGLQFYYGQAHHEVNTLIFQARERLALLDAKYTEEHQAVKLIRSQLFVLLRTYYEKRDDILIKIEHRRRFLEALTRNDNVATQTIADDENRERDENHQKYEQAANDASERHLLSSEEQTEVREIYRKLASLYHPDRYVNDLSKQGAYAELMKLINQAKDSGAIDVLREIAQDPNQFLASHGYELISIIDESGIEGLRSLLKVLQDKILESQKLLDDLRSSSDYELWKLCEQDPDFLEVFAKEQQKDLESEIRNLEEESSLLAKQINDIASPDSPYRI